MQNHRGYKGGSFWREKTQVINSYIDYASLQRL